MAKEYRVAPYFGSYYYGFNNTKPPFKNNPDLRKALNMAIDRDILVNIVIGAGQIPAYNFVFDRGNKAISWNLSSANDDVYKYISIDCHVERLP
jgi:ABC-type oligopeptide transport system substrate-binding subunit